MAIVCVAVVVAIFFSINGLMNVVQERRSPAKPPSTDPLPASVGSADSGEPESEEKTGIEALWYYEEDRAERYKNFRALHPEYSDDEICWMVDCDLDIEPYTDMQPVPDPNDILQLTNKHFYLPEDYIPDDMISVGGTQMRKEAGEAALEMINAAASEGLNLWSQSGYRSYDLQTQLYNDYSARDGSDAADTYSARPGHSEHQSGLATDLNTITNAFGDTAEGKWTAENCWKYGFIVRYTQENTGVTSYIYEPWHVRYIGKDAAKTMRDEGFASFEEYWVKYVKHTQRP